MVVKLSRLEVVETRRVLVFGGRCVGHVARVNLARGVRVERDPSLVLSEMIV